MVFRKQEAKMNSREKILERVQKNQPPLSGLPDLNHERSGSSQSIQKFVRSLGNIGGTAIDAMSWNEIESILRERFPSTARRISLIPQLGSSGINGDFEKDPRTLENVSVSILAGHFAVAENGAVWVNEENMGDRVLPFICEHLVLVVNASAVVESMQDAYELLDSSDHSFGTFIAGPSKTADIEQSLVLGAHGPKTLSVFLLHA
ncbi:MAG TPA: LUD domain-containing protein [Chryseolinea sp.]